MVTLLKDDLVKKILSLSPMKRVEIVDNVLNGLNLEGETNYEYFWAQEVEERVEAVQEGTIELIPSNKVFAKISSLK